jgi:hypothetical protein
MNEEEFDLLRQEAEALAAALNDARDAVEQGTPLEMDGLDVWVSRVCDGAVALPGPLARRLLPQLDAVVAGMDALSASLARQQEFLMNAASAAPDPATARRRAASAYGGAPGPQVPVTVTPPAVTPPATPGPTGRDKP